MFIATESHGNNLMPGYEWHGGFNDQVQKVQHDAA